MSADEVAWIGRFVLGLLLSAPVGLVALALSSPRSLEAVRAAIRLGRE